MLDSVLSLGMFQLKRYEFRIKLGNLEHLFLLDFGMGKRFNTVEDNVGFEVEGIR